MISVIALFFREYAAKLVRVSGKLILVKLFSAKASLEIVISPSGKSILTKSF